MQYQLMIVDDDPILVMILEKLIENHHLHSNPLSFDNGISALDYLKKHYSSDETFVIFLDINMPEMTGWKFIDSIAGFTHSSRVLIVVLTSSIGREDMEKAAKNQYVVDYLTKPIISESLVEIFDKIEGKLNSG